MNNSEQKTSKLITFLRKLYYSTLIGFFMMIGRIFMMESPGNSDIGPYYQTDDIVIWSEPSGLEDGYQVIDSDTIPEQPTYTNINQDTAYLSHKVDNSPTIMETPVQPYTLYVNRQTISGLEFPYENAKEMQSFGIGNQLTITHNVSNDAGENWVKLDIGSYIKRDYLCEQPPMEYIGDFKITYYCNCKKCCGRWAHMGITASGAPLQEGVSIATDSSIPFGTKLMINGHVYVVQDRGSGVNGNHVDVYCSNHQEAKRHGCQKLPVYKIH